NSSFDIGITEGGSSGSPLFNQNHLIVGQLHGGAPIDDPCDGTKESKYGRFDKSWEGGGDSFSRLNEYLDPNYSGVTTLIGLDPYANNPLYIDITRPLPMEVWIASTTKLIKWTSNAGGDVAITLWENFNYVSTIADLEDNDGVYSWNIPSDLSSSNKYQVKVTSYLPNVIEGQSDLFTIIPQADYYIDVSDPDPGDSWYHGDQALVSWSSNKGDYVSIELHNSGGFVRTFEYTYPNNSNNNYLFTVPADITNGSDYRVRVTSKIDGSLYDESGIFTVAHHIYVADELIVNDPPYQAAISPASDEDWYTFRTMLPGTYFIETHGSVDTYMYLYESNASTLVRDNNDGGIDLNAKIAWELNGNSLYYVLVHEDGYNATGNYSIDVTGLNINYPHIVLNTEDLNFDSVNNGANPAPQTFTLTNNSDGTLNWSISEDITWLRVDQGSGNSNSQQITINITSNDLPVGTYNSTVEISSNNADNSPHYVNIKYTVEDRCTNGSMIYNTSSGKFNFCEDGVWIVKGTCESPGVPILSFPDNGLGSVSISPTFDWNDVNNASTYLLAIDGNDSFSNPDLQLCTESQFAAFEMYYSITHYWKVKVFNECGGGEWSDTWSFTTEAPSIVVNIPDANLEAVIRTTLSKPLGDITANDLATIESLDGNFKNISNLSGIEYCSNILDLRLAYNNLSNIDQIAVLTTLTGLNLKNNSLSSIIALSGLTNLADLSIEENNISDISSLSSLTNLWYFGFGNNNISDISVLTNMTALTDLSFESNNVSNILSLAGLVYLKYVSIGSNLISDIYPLTQNPGLGTGDDVYLNGNPLSTTSINVYIPQLEANGVDVHY
ncbi:MAG: Ser-Thr-rich GPI-anchored membrane family protein, partial [Candidatus Neomarinimicrobiota bacterium]